MELNHQIALPRKIENLGYWILNLGKWVMLIPVLFAVYLYVALIPCKGTDIMVELFKEWNNWWTARWK